MKNTLTAIYKLYEIESGFFITEGSISFDYSVDTLDCPGEVLNSNDYFAEQANELDEEVLQIENEGNTIKVIYETCYAVIKL